MWTFMIHCGGSVVVLRHQVVWVLIAEFPMPSEEQLRRAEPESFQKAFPGDNVQLMIDAHEQQCEESANLEGRHTLWSDYKHRCTNK
jgi:hypothetical protein